MITLAPVIIFRASFLQDNVERWEPFFVVVASRKDNGLRPLKLREPLTVRILCNITNVFYMDAEELVGGTKWKVKKVKWKIMEVSHKQWYHRGASDGSYNEYL